MNIPKNKLDECCSSREDKKKRAAYQKYMKTILGYDYKKYAKDRKQSKLTRRTALMDFEGNIAKEEKLNTKAFYAYARSKLNENEGIPELDDENGNLMTQYTNKADLLKKLMCSFFTTNFMYRTFSNTLTDISYKQATLSN